MGESNYITQEGYNKLKSELEDLEKRKRHLAQELKKASKFGDLRENSEFLYAKDDMHKVKMRIQQTEKILRDSEILNKDKIETSEINVGNVVTIFDLNNKEKIKYKIVGNGESEPNKNKIGINTPIGQGLLSKEKGDIIKIDIPAGQLKYKILSIE